MLYVRLAPVLLFCFTRNLTPLLHIVTRAIVKPTEVIETLKWPSKRGTFTNSGCGKLAEVLIWAHFSAIQRHATFAS